LHKKLIIIKNKERISGEKVASYSFLYKKLCVNLLTYPTIRE